MKLTTHLYSPIRLHGVALNYLSTEKILPFFFLQIRFIYSLSLSILEYSISASCSIDAPFYNPFFPSNATINNNNNSYLIHTMIVKYIKCY
jgi:hypothetical protein